MNKVHFLFTLKFLLSIIVTTYIIDKIVYISINRISKEVRTGQTIGKLNQYLEIKDTLDNIVFGNSRANHNIDPLKISNNSFNVGVDGTHLAYSYTLIKLLPEDKPQTIILNIDIKPAFNLNYIGDDLTKLKTKYHSIPEVKKQFKRFKQSSILNEFFWTLSFNNSTLGLLRNFITPKYDYKNYKGFDPIDVSEVQQQVFNKYLNNKKNSVRNFDCKEKYQLNTTYENLLNDLLKYCKNNNKNLILYTSPEYNDLCKEDNLALKEILNDKGFNYHDFTDFFIEQNSFSYWKDETHLSRKGAKIFSEKIKEITEKN